jgi:hypothetical protein
MKQISVFLLAFMAPIFSCKKESNQKFCWKCTTTVSYSSSYLGSGSSTTTLCDQSQSDIDKYEKAGTQTTTSSAGGYTVTMNTTTNCVRQ